VIPKLLINMEFGIKKMSSLFSRKVSALYLTAVKGIVSPDWGALLVVLLDRYELLEMAES
jgi:hypothetical protein